MSKDFTPESERQRIQLQAYLNPELLSNEFSHLEFPRRITKKDLGKKVLYRDAGMTRWSLKTVTEEDTRFPLIYGEGKRTRMMATIGVTQGFGDHDLKVYDSDIHIKPFLTPMPEVRIYDMSSECHSADDVFIMGSDGLWDVTPNEKAPSIVADSLKQFGPDMLRYCSAAQDLVIHSRGMLKESWRTMDDQPASCDDITAFVIPLHRYSSNLSIHREDSPTESSSETNS